MQEARPVALAIGGSHGLAPDLMAAAADRWSLGPLTLPHELARVVVAEQLYRAVTILRGEPYHKGAGDARMTEWFEEWFGEEYLRLYPHRDAAEAERAVALILDRVGFTADGACSTWPAAPGGMPARSRPPARAASGSISRPRCSAWRAR